ncbi:MAG: sulfatase-like hydrolase/transferase, partial [Planctomycetota bacterium]|nr:sulfatase-like hydrolase/transferase [Planctomycetota bacterium]
MFRIIILLLVLSPALPLIGGERPNVLFLVVDDMNDWVGCMQSEPRAITPNLDRLAKRGVLFTNAHTAGVFCAPSRAAIFSGQYASTTGCYRTANYFVHRPEIESLQTSFSKAGYKTFGAGKLYHHPAGAIDIRDWDQFFLRTPEQRGLGWALDSWSEGTPFPHPFPHSPYNKGTEITGGLFLEWGALPDDREDEMADTQRIDWAVERLKEVHEQPFFLGVGLYAPHYPNYCPEKYFDLYRQDDLKRPQIKPDDLEDLPPKIRKIKEARSRIHQKLEDLNAVEDAIHGYL